MSYNVCVTARIVFPSEAEAEAFLEACGREPHWGWGILSREAGVAYLERDEARWVRGEILAYLEGYPYPKGTSGEARITGEDEEDRELLLIEDGRTSSFRIHLRWVDQKGTELPWSPLT